MDDSAPEITVTPIPDGPRRRIQASTQLLHDWITLAHPNAWVKYEMRLGPTPLSIPGYPVTPQTEAMLRRANMYADAVIIEPGAVTVVEAAVVGYPGKISQLRAYAALIMNTPELAPYIARQLIEMHLWAVDSEIAHQMAVAHGQQVTIYTPPWIENYLSEKYWRRGSALPPA